MPCPGYTHRHSHRHTLPFWIARWGPNQWPKNKIARNAETSNVHSWRIENPYGIIREYHFTSILSTAKNSTMVTSQGRSLHRRMQWVSVSTAIEHSSQHIASWVLELNVTCSEWYVPHLPDARMLLVIKSTFSCYVYTFFKLFVKWSRFCQEPIMIGCLTKSCIPNIQSPIHI